MIREDFGSIISHIDCGSCSHDEWLEVGMALKHEGYPLEVWKGWSATDSSRFNSGECERRWRSFNGSNTPVTGGTIISMAYDRGWRPAKQKDYDDDGYELAWDAVIGKGIKAFDENDIERMMLKEPEDWKPIKDISTYIRALFNADENVAYCTESWEANGKYMPTKGNYDRTAGQLLDELSKAKEIQDVFGDYKEECGAWIRFNPFDGKGVKNENVADFRYALVESDTMEISKQNALIRKLQLPVACLVHSGGKSIHAIVKINAKDKEEYAERVQFLYNICEGHGMSIDRQNKNPSRLSRMPGITRKGKKQYLIDTNIGKRDWLEWREYIDAITDGMPDIENLADLVENPTPLSPVIIEGCFRKGHKMMIAGASKAGKSFLLMELCLAFSSGGKWLGLQCEKGKVLYINMEIDPASCRQRFEKIADALKLQKSVFNNIDIWNLRGKTESLSKMVPKLVRRAKDNGYIAIVLDPIYKVQMGDENAAGDIGIFCNQLDRICAETLAAVIYCHHHSKGDQSEKRSADRASGSGVFARDADALLDLIELDATDIEGEFAGCTAWRLETTLREFPALDSINMFFKYPVHIEDEEGLLEEADSMKFGKTKAERKEEARKKADKNIESVKNAYFSINNLVTTVTVKSISEFLGVSEKTVRNWVKKSDEIIIENGAVRVVL